MSKLGRFVALVATVDALAFLGVFLWSWSLAAVVLSLLTIGYFMVALAGALGALASMGIWYFNPHDDDRPPLRWCLVLAMLALPALMHMRLIHERVPDALQAAPRTTVSGTRVIEVTRDPISSTGRVVYVVIRDAAGHDTIGYSDADFRTLSVSRDGECYRQAYIKDELPIACTQETR